MARTLRNFGALSTYSTFNFEDLLGEKLHQISPPMYVFDTVAVLGRLTRSCKSTRRHALEIMNNIMYLRDACFELTTTDIPSSLHDLVSSWLGLQRTDFMSPYHHIRLLHRLKFDNVLIKSMFRGEITYYSTAFMGHVRFTTSDQTRNKVIDDSNIIF